jgi:hypothetical protein
MQTEEEIFGRGSLRNSWSGTCGTKVRAVCENIEKEEELYALCANGEEPGRKEPA